MAQNKEITYDGCPEYMAAAKKTLLERQAHGGGGCSWSRAWLINFWARLKDADRAYSLASGETQKLT